MEVVRDTFQELLPLVKQTIEESDFVAIDTEFTGLSTHKNRISPFDDLGLRYSKLRETAKAFRVIQFGLATFRYEPGDGGGLASGHWVTRPFNFYIFADEMDDYSSDRVYRVFSCQPSSLLFLSQCGFDFNKLFQQGIPYATPEDLEKRRAKKEAMAALPDIPIDESNKDFFENARMLVNDWLQHPRESELSVPCPSSYHRRLVYQLIRGDIYNGRLVCAKDDRGNMSVKRMTDEEIRQLEGKPEVSKPNFGDVLEIIRTAGKPVIGHNALLDFCFTMEQFRGELPDDLPAFKESLKRLCNTVFDTKHIAIVDPSVQDMVGAMGSTTLGPLYERVMGAGFETAPKIVMAPSFDRYSSGHGGQQRLHEAGYDAYCTGAAFARLAWLIMGGQANPVGRIDFGHAKLVPYVNRLYVMQSDVQWISLDGPDDVPASKPNYFYLSNLPPAFTNLSLNEAFRDYAPVAWRWVDQTTAWMIVKDAAKIPQVRLGDVARGNAAGANIMNWDQWYRFKYGRQEKKESGGENEGHSSNREAAETTSTDASNTPSSPSVKLKRKEAPSSENSPRSRSVSRPKWSRLSKE